MQQDAFHKLDACTRPERLKVINEAVQELIGNSISFSQNGMEDEELKGVVKTKFDELRQWWKDWNSNAQSEEEIAGLSKRIEKFILQEEFAL